MIFVFYIGIPRFPPPASTGQRLLLTLLPSLPPSFSFSGFSHKIQTLLHKVLESLLSLSLHEGLFALIKEKQIDAYNNIALARPDEHGQMFLSLLLTEGRWAWRDKLRRVEGMQMGDLAAFHKEMLGRQNCVKVGVFGNVSEESALGVGEQVERLLRRNGRFEPLSPSVQVITLTLTEGRTEGKKEEGRVCGYWCESVHA